MRLITENNTVVKKKQKEHDNQQHNHKSHDVHESHDDTEEQQNKFGISMAIVSIDKQKNTFELSNRLLEILNIQISQLKQFKTSIAEDIYLLPKNIFVKSKNDYGIYSFKNNKVKLIKVKLIKRKGDKYLVKIREFSKIKNIVLTSIAILRAAELHVFGEESHGHAH